jgi:hypothetical protein
MSEERTDNVKDLHLLACLVWPRDRGYSFPGILPVHRGPHPLAGDVHEARDCWLVLPASQSRANSSNSDPDDMVHLHQGSIRRLE